MTVKNRQVQIPAREMDLTIRVRGIEIPAIPMGYGQWLQIYMPSRAGIRRNKISVLILLEAWSKNIHEVEYKTRHHSPKYEGSGSAFKIQTSWTIQYLL